MANNMNTYVPKFIPDNLPWLKKRWVDDLV